MRHPHALRIAQNEKTRQWYWRLVAENGRTVADGGEGYHNEADCLHGIRLVKGGPLPLPSDAPELDCSAAGSRSRS